MGPVSSLAHIAATAWQLYRICSLPRLYTEQTAWHLDSPGGRMAPNRVAVLATTTRRQQTSTHSPGTTKPPPHSPSEPELPRSGSGAFPLRGRTRRSSKPLLLSPGRPIPLAAAFRRDRYGDWSAWRCRPDEKAPGVLLPLARMSSPCPHALPPILPDRLLDPSPHRFRRFCQAPFLCPARAAILRLYISRRALGVGHTEWRPSTECGPRCRGTPL